MDCPLCKLVKGNIITKLYYQNRIITIVDCVKCHIPMVVLNKHKVKPTLLELTHMLPIISKVLSNNDWKFRGYMRTIKDHWHEHILVK